MAQRTTVPTWAWEGERLWGSSGLQIVPRVGVQEFRMVFQVKLLEFRPPGSRLSWGL